MLFTFATFPFKVAEFLAAFFLILPIETSLACLKNDNFYYICVITKNLKWRVPDEKESDCRVIIFLLSFK